MGYIWLVFSWCILSPLIVFIPDYLDDYFINSPHCRQTFKKARITERRREFSKDLCKSPFFSFYSHGGQSPGFATGHGLPPFCSWGTLVEPCLVCMSKWVGCVTGQNWQIFSVLNFSDKWCASYELMITKVI